MNAKHYIHGAAQLLRAPIEEAMSASAVIMTATPRGLHRTPEQAKDLQTCQAVLGSLMPLQDALTALLSRADIPGDDPRPTNLQPANFAAPKESKQ